MGSVAALGVILLIAAAAWVVSVRKHDVSFVDSLWPLFFLAAAILFAVDAGAGSARSAIVLALVALWAVRLSVHITLRNRGEPEDYRYRQIRANNEPGFAFKSLFIVFGLQGVLAWIVAAPLLPAIASSAPLGVVDCLAIVLWTAGFAFESVGDYQLSRFRKAPASKGQVLSTGLWRYTRHPNYFGEFCIWWAFWLFAAASGAWWTLFSPLLMSVLLLRVSGVAMLEKTIGERRPAYAEYVRRTNAFFPGPVRARSAPKRTESSR